MGGGSEVKVLKEAIKSSDSPDIAFHGTNQQYEKFLEEMINKGAGAKFGKGVYLSSSKDVAKTYADLSSGLKGGKSRLLEVAIPDSMKIKTYDGPISGLKAAGEAARKEGFKGIKYNAGDDFIKIPGLRKLDTTGHSNYIIFNPSDARIISNHVIKEIGLVKGMGLMRDLLAGSIVGLSAIEIGAMVKDRFFSEKQEQGQVPRG